ncbi:MAG TPA: hypothetical protein VL728_17150 [Cyclobacteriaceae bacterium]|jgi:hypothetical protein|nr:hypothetical protein [Cyclobacteriaceae bacterium]
MNHYFLKIVTLCFTVFFLAAGCKSHKKAASITNVPAEKPKVQEETKLQPKEADEEAKLLAMKEDTYKGRLGQYFDAIANANNVTSANTSIDEALYMFSSPQTPVLIVISQEGNQKDYDRPTSIRTYLNYLKDQKKNINQITHLKMDETGKITEVELRKGN